MKSHPILWLGLMFVALSAILISLNNSTSAQNVPTNRLPTWEYKVADARKAVEDFDLSSDPSSERIKETLEKFLTQQGSGGWELVAYSGSMAIYKREAGITRRIE